MKPHNLLSVGPLMMALVLLPATASAQRGSGRHPGGHHDGGAVAGAVVIVGQAVALPLVVVESVVVAPPVVVPQPIIGGWESPGSFDRIGFGSMPVRTGFGTLPVRTGFDTTPVRTGFGVQTGPAPAPGIIGRRDAFRPKDVRALKQRRVVGGVIVVGYPVPYLYAYLPHYSVTTSSAGYYLPPFERPSGVHGAGGVSASPSTYWVDLSNEAGASSGLIFDVSPAAAEVYVDGRYMGTIQDFSAHSEPLMVVPGSHRIELRAPGHRTTELDVTTAAGQVIPYVGELERLLP